MRRRFIYAINNLRQSELHNSEERHGNPFSFDSFDVHLMWQTYQGGKEEGEDEGWSKWGLLLLIDDDKKMSGLIRCLIVAWRNAALKS